MDKLTLFEELENELTQKTNLIQYLKNKRKPTNNSAKNIELSYEARCNPLES